MKIPEDVSNVRDLDIQVNFVNGNVPVLIVERNSMDPVANTQHVVQIAVKIIPPQVSNAQNSSLKKKFWQLEIKKKSVSRKLTSVPGNFIYDLGSVLLML